MSRALVSLVTVSTGLIVAVSSLAGCKSADKAEENAPKSPNRGEKPLAKPDDGAVKPARPAVKPIAASAVKDLMQRWLAAQNEGDFPAYEALYAERLEGVRRSGEKIVRLDRKGWVKERGRMFKRKMIVEMNDVDIDVFTKSAIVTFSQRWASGKYEDVGPKQMVVVPEDGQLRIAREEMLQSTLIGDARKTALADKRFVFVIAAGQGEYAVLDKLGNMPVSGFKLISQDEPVVVSAAVESDKLPASVAEWRGAILESGPCQATVSDILALSRIVPHFGERQTWSGEFDDNPPMAEDDIARAAFHEDGAYLVGTLRTDGCSMGAHASVANQPAPTRADRVTDGTGALVKAARKAFRALEGYKELATEFRSYGQEGNWEEYASGGGKPGEIVVTVMRHTGNHKLFAVAQAHSGSGCGDFEGSLTAFFEVSGKLAAPKLKKVHETRTHPRIIAALDMADNGALAFLVEDVGNTVLTGLDGKVLRTLTVPFFDCGC